MIRSFQIFDRWGGAVHSRVDIPANDSQFGWDGTYRGEDVNPGVYLYVVEIELTDGTLLTKTGEVVLLK